MLTDLSKSRSNFSQDCRDLQTAEAHKNETITKMLDHVNTESLNSKSEPGITNSQY